MHVVSDCLAGVDDDLTNSCSSNTIHLYYRLVKVLPVAEHTHTHPFNGPLSGTTRVSRYQKGKTNVDFTEARVKALLS